MRTVIVAGGDLYQIALIELGNAAQWWRIAEANGLTDPILTGGLTSLLIPGEDATLTDGVPPQ
jgi:nucleoid-associated protein YgaU